MHRAEPCPVPGCIEPIRGGHLMCRRHWRMVPAELRKIVNRTWKALTQSMRQPDLSTPKLKLNWQRAEMDARNAVIAIEYAAEQEGIHEAAL